MKVTVEVELKPFIVPNYALQVSKSGKREDGFIEDQKFHLSDLDPITLSNLCDEFRREVFRKAGKEQPPDAR